MSVVVRPRGAHRAPPFVPDPSAPRHGPAADEDAFTAIYRAHYATLCGVARRYVRTREAAEELVQDVLLRFWEQRSGWTFREGLQAYLHAAVRNQALDALRRDAVAHRWQERVVREGETGIGQRPAGADDDVVAGELAQAVARVVATLPPRCREAYVLRREHFLSLDEIARVMGIAPKTVEIQIGLALRALRRGLADWLPGPVLVAARAGTHLRASLPSDTPPPSEPP